MMDKSSRNIYNGSEVTQSKGQGKGSNDTAVSIGLDDIQIQRDIVPIPKKKANPIGKLLKLKQAFMTTI